MIISCRCYQYCRRSNCIHLHDMEAESSSSMLVTNAWTTPCHSLEDNNSKLCCAISPRQLTPKQCYNYHVITEQHTPLYVWSCTLCTWTPQKLWASRRWVFIEGWQIFCSALVQIHKVDRLRCSNSSGGGGGSNSSSSSEVFSSCFSWPAVKLIVTVWNHRQQICIHIFSL